MSRVFKVKPKRLKKVNGLVLTPEMEVIVTTKINMSDPFSNCAKELKEAYMRLYSFDMRKLVATEGILISRHLIDRYIFLCQP